MKTARPISATSLLVFIFLMLPATLGAQKMSLVEYYRAIPAGYFGDEKYELKPKGKTWVTQSMAQYELEVTVDTINGFLEIKDEGTGGGTVIHQLAIFLKKDGRRLIAVNRSDFDGIISSSKLTFLVRETDGWTNVTASVLPQIGMEAFLTAGFVEANQEKLKNLTDVRILYDLPRKGTDIEVRFDFNMFDPRVSPGAQSDTEFYGQMHSQVDIGVRRLVFDRTSGNFRLK